MAPEQNDQGGDDYSSDEESHSMRSSGDRPASPQQPMMTTKTERRKSTLRPQPNQRRPSVQQLGFEQLFPTETTKRSSRRRPSTASSGSRGRANSIGSSGSGRPSGSQQRPRSASVPRVAMLAQAKARQSATRKSKYLTSDDLECTFQPRINRQSRNVSRGSSALLKRMDAEVHSRRRTLEVKRGEKAYNARVDKKTCPQCGATQSYDEYTNRKNKCQGCGVAYRHKKTWHEVSSTFLERQMAKQEERERKLKQIEEETKPSFRPDSVKAVLDHRSGKTRMLKTGPVQWTQVRGNFMHRLETDMSRRRSKLHLQEQMAQDPANAGCTFRPRTSASFSSSGKGYFHGSTEAEPFLERMEQDVEKRMMRKAPITASSRDAHPDSLRSTWAAQQNAQHWRFPTSRTRGAGAMRPAVSTARVLG